MQKIDCDIVAITHRIFSEGERKTGGFDKIINYFSRSKDKTILLIEHPLRALTEKGSQDWNAVIVSLIRNGKLQEVERIEKSKKPNVLNWIGETIFNIRYIKKNVSGNPILMTADPLNGLVGVLYKSKFSKVYYHSIDYSKNRLNNFLLNFIYRTILFFVLRNADVVGVVSQRMKDELIKLSNCENHILSVPNSPVFKEMQIPERKNVLVCTGRAVIEKYNYVFIIDLMAELKKDVKDIRLYIVGSLEDKNYCDMLYKKIEELHLHDNIIFTGFLSLEQLDEILIKSKIGLCFYDEKCLEYVYYGDPLKMREYALYGIPIISNGKTGCDSEIVNEKCGLIIKDIDDAKNKIKLLLNDGKLYKKYQDNCLLWAKKNDKRRILEKLYAKLENKK